MTQNMIIYVPTDEAKCISKAETPRLESKLKWQGLNVPSPRYHAGEILIAPLSSTNCHKLCPYLADNPRDENSKVCLNPMITTRKLGDTDLAYLIRSKEIDAANRIGEIARAIRKEYPTKYTIDDEMNAQKSTRPSRRLAIANLITKPIHDKYVSLRDKIYTALNIN